MDALTESLPAGPNAGFEVEYRLKADEPLRAVLAGCADVRLEDAAAFRPFRFAKGLRSFAGWWWPQARQLPEPASGPASAAARCLNCSVVVALSLKHMLTAVSSATSSGCYAASARTAPAAA